MARRSAIARWLPTFGKNLWIINAVLCGAMAWALLGYFHVYRLKVSAMAEGQNTDVQWTFGQVLAIATWAPLLSEIAVVLICKSWFRQNTSAGVESVTNSISNRWS